MAPKWTRTALRTLDEIFRYIAADDPVRAQSFAQELRAKIERLGEFPELGHPGRVVGTRELVLHPRYLVIYRVKQGQVSVLRIHHTAMARR